ncbi:hypothetical protein D7Y23_19400 [Corallococcus sp. AB050B]|nr:hypothetical protein D7Y23_19400 [Corallococcus sp. AB050B]
MPPPDAGIADAGTPDAGIPDAGIPDAGTESPATLTVHSDWWSFSREFGLIERITVLLGDGSRFRQPLGLDGIARFDDPAITGPQDITFVIVGVGGGKVVASTTLDVEGSEVWIRSGYDLGGGSPGVKQATLTGQVMNNGGNLTDLRVVGNGFSGSDFALSDGNFSFDVTGRNPGRVSLLASGNTGHVMALGMLRDIAVGEGRTVSGLAVTLDHPMDERLAVQVADLQPYGSLSSVSATFRLDSEFLFKNSADAEPFEVPAIARTPPFDTVEVLLSVTAGRDEKIPSGRVVMNVPLAPTGATPLTLPPPMTLTSPTPGTSAAPGSGPRSGLTLSWSAAPAAHTVTMRLIPQQGTPDLAWYVTAPATAAGFRPFPLPTEVSALRELTTGRYFVDWSSRFLGAGKGYQDAFQETALADGPGTWNTLAYGYVILRD